MACLGVHFALTEDQVQLLREGDDASRLEYLQETLEPHFFDVEPDAKVETDKAWDAIHRCLTDGTLRDDGGAYPLNHAILGGETVYSGDDYIMSLKSPAQVRDVAVALRTVTQDLLRSVYDQIDPDDYGSELSDDDFTYTWEWLTGIQVFWELASQRGRYVLFTADQ